MYSFYQCVAKFNKRCVVVLFCGIFFWGGGLNLPIFEKSD